MGRILALLKKDWIYLVFVPIITMFISVIILLVFQSTSGANIKIGVYGTLKATEGFEIEYVENLDSGIKLIENNELEVLFDSYNKKIYASENNPELANKVYEMIIVSKESDLVAKNKETDNLLIFFVSITVVIASLSATSILDIVENTNIFKSMLLTPLKYSEFILEKLIIVLISFWFTLGVGFIVINLLDISLGQSTLSIFIYSTISLLALTLIGITITLSLKNVDLSLTLNSLFIQFCFLLVIFAYQNGFAIILPITSGINSIVKYNKFPTTQFLLISVFGIILSYICLKLFKRRMCT